jgi:hypothetical protein
LQQELNTIYRQGLASWTVEVAPTILAGDTLWDKDGNGRINTGSDLFNRYSNELKAINRFIKSQSYYKPNEYYLVVTNKPTDSLSAELLGEMPRGKNIGYIFSSAPKAQLIAHELGHGAFAFEHSFEGNATLPKHSSSCLMDYMNGTQLYKGKYWDYIHNPTTIIGISEDDDESAGYAENVKKKIFELLNDIKVAYQNNTTLTLNPYIKLYSPSCGLAGVTYDYISISGCAQSGITIHPKNNIKFGASAHYYASTGQTINYPCLDIDGKLKIEVTANNQSMLQLMKYYLEGYMTGRNLLVFVNGYRSVAVLETITSLSLENPKEADEISTGDTHGYWEGIDAMFINQIGTRNVVYADGHNSIITSNHRDYGNAALSVHNFLGAMLNANELKKICEGQSSASVCNTMQGGFLHKTPNTVGFSTRKSNGMNAGNDLLAKINNGEIKFDKNTDTLDVVCHSMGYAYALGMIDVFKIAGITCGRLYIIAPENASCGPVPTNFEEIWQYGSNENRDYSFLQDGVAPQIPASGIETLPNGKIGGRVYIPNDGSIPMGFVESHMISNYKWIFKLDKERNGYVKPRK